MSDDTLRRFFPNLDKAAQEPENPRHYKAWEKQRDRELRLNIRDRHGRHHTIPYATIIFVQYMPDSLMLLMTSHYIVTLKGCHLDELEGLLQDEQVRTIQEFDQKIHDKPDDNDPVIQTIDIKWLKQEFEPQ